ncbi:phage tail protein [Lelliottia sp. SL45]|uniref:phage tail-collar fiber domain-containing protein n=1 Tax=Lelliottia sp. SL45 TaxID=2994665 RepID=UPI0022726DC4|nr:phage tail protein [Lelliottia sp. SL45]MCY1698665.1 phage tail protein [Lelliottia sp. SL45]
MTAGLILTFSGANEIEAAYQAGETVKITLCSFGDGGGEPVTADPSATALKGRFGEVPLSAGDAFDGMIGGMAIIPCADYPGKIVREFGLESESGTLIAYGAYPETYLPAQGDSVIKELIVKFVMPLVHAENVTLIVDPNIAIITQEEGDKRYYRRALRLQEVQDEGAAAQQELRENIGCGTSATKDIVTSTSDTTAGRVLNVGAGGLLGMALPVTDANLTNKDGLVSMMFNQGGGSNSIHFGGYGCGVHLFYGDSGDGTQALSANIFVDSAGNLWAEWLAIKKTDGSVVAQRKQKLWGPFNKPTPGDIGALPAFPNVLAVDLNTLGDRSDHGVYYQASNAGATAAYHYPAQVAGTLFVTQSAYGCQQMYTTYSGRMFLRAVQGAWTGSGPWSEWVEMYGPNHIPTAGDVKALPITGGTLTGNLEIADTAPIITLTDTNQVPTKKYLLVNDGGDVRLDEDSTVGNNVWTWRSATNVFTVNGQVVPVDYGNFDARYAMSPSLAGFGGVGTYAFLSCNAAVANGATVAGASLFSSGIAAQKSSVGYGDKSMVIQGSAMAGTWKCLGNQPAPSGSDVGATLYYRIA